MDSVLGKAQILRVERPFHDQPSSVINGNRLANKKSPVPSNPSDLLTENTCSKFERFKAISTPRFILK